MKYKLYINISIWDYWIIDNHKLNEGYVVYILMQINDTLKLIEKNLNDIIDDNKERIKGGY